jgi:uncharacterized membrane protein
MSSGDQSGDQSSQTDEHIRNPIEWGIAQVKAAAHNINRASHGIGHHELSQREAHPEIRRIAVHELWDALRKGWKDVGAKRADIITLCVIYPVAGLVLARLASGSDLLPLVFPLASGFAIIGPITAVGLYEISRRIEAGLDVTWANVFGVVRAPAFGALVVLSLLLFGVFLLWLTAAYFIYQFTLGPEPPTSIGSFIGDVFTTGAGWTMIVIGVGVGFLFAVLALAIGVVSFPMLVDRDVGVAVAVSTSIRAVLANPVPMVVWGMVVTSGLVIGSIPALIGLIVILPLLGHATWHLYRKVVVY